MVQHPGELEGGQGSMLDRSLTLAGLSREEVSLGSAIRCQRWAPYDVPTVKELKGALEHCHRSHWKHPEGARLIVAQGELPLYQLTEEVSTAEWRGWLLRQQGENSESDSGIYHPSHTDLPVLSVLGPRSLMVQPEMAMVNRLDWGKVARYLSGTWPSKLPVIKTEAPRIWPSICSFDTEYTYPGDPWVYRYSLATPERKVYVIETSHFPRQIVSPRPSQVILHNAIADVSFLHRLVVPSRYITIEDSMYAHSCLWSGMSREKEDDRKSNP